MATKTEETSVTEEVAVVETKEVKDEVDHYPHIDDPKIKKALAEADKAHEPSDEIKALQKVHDDEFTPPEVRDLLTTAINLLNAKEQQINAAKAAKKEAEKKA